MSNDLNLCQFIGRLGQTPESRFMPSGDEVVNMSIAVGKSWKDKQTGEKKESTTWIKCAVFGPLAGVCSKYLDKGSRIYVSGEWRNRTWQAQDGTDRHSTELVVNQMQMLDSKNDGSHNTKNESSNSRPQTSNQPQPQSGTSGAQSGGGFNDFDDDIPFAPLGREHFV